MDSDNTRLISSEADDFRRKAPWFGTRHVFALLGFFGFVNAYAMRVNLSVAIVVMVNNTANNHHNNGSSVNNNTCPVPLGPNSTEPVAPKDGPFAWDETTQGYVLGSFFYGYVVTQIPGGRLAEMFGGKWIFGLGILVTSVFTLLTPLAAKLSFYALIVVRVIEGLGEGVTFPVMHAMLSQWAPPMERTKMVAMVYAGSQMGTVISLPISGVLCDYLGWESVFYVFGALGLVWFVLWTIFVYDTPEKHPFISAAERDLIETSLGKRSAHAHTEPSTSDEGSSERAQLIKRPGPPIPWKSILTSVPFWAILIAHCSQNWGFYTLLTELPTYMNQILHFDIKTNAFLSALPYALMWILSVLGSLAADHIRSKGYLSTTATRKIANTIAFYIPAISLSCLSLAGCQHEAVLGLLCVTVGFNGLNYSGFNANHIDIASNFAGTLMGITNMFANFMGFLAPMAVSAIVEGHQDLQHWQTVFYIAAAVYIVGNTFFLIFGTGKEQAWNAIDPVMEDPTRVTSEVDGVRRVVGPIIPVSSRDMIGEDLY